MDLIKKSILILSLGFIVIYECVASAASDASPESTVDNPYSVSFGICSNCDENARMMLAIDLTGEYITAPQCSDSDKLCKQHQQSKEYAWAYIIDSKSGKNFKYTVEITPTNSKQVVGLKTSGFDERDTTVFSNYHSVVKRQEKGVKMFVAEMEAELSGDESKANTTDNLEKKLNNLVVSHKAMQKKSEAFSLNQHQNEFGLNITTIDCSSAAQNGSYIYALFVDNNKGIRDLNSNYYKYAHQVKNQQSLIALFSNGKNRGIKKINLPKVISYPKTLTTIEFESGSLTFDAKFNQNDRYHVSILYDQSFDREGVSLEERFKALGNGMVEFSNPCDAVEAAKAFVSNSVLDVSGFDSIALAPKQAYYAFPNNSACLNRLKTFDPNKHTNVKYTPTIIKHSDDTGEIYIKARAYNDTEHIEIKTTCSKMK